MCVYLIFQYSLNVILVQFLKFDVFCFFVQVLLRFYYALGRFSSHPVNFNYVPFRSASGSPTHLMLCERPGDGGFTKGVA